MAQKLAPSEVVLNVEEALDIIDKTMERVKSLYEQYFLGIQKQPPTFIHNDLERKLRDLQQIQIRNTALRYRYATLQQKFGSYNSYWRRTLRQIENGTYVRSLAKIGRKAIESGEDIPEEILAKMPKRMREAVRRDREAALALAKRRNQEVVPEDDGGDFYEDFTAGQAAQKPAGKVDSRGAHILSEDEDLDLDAYFKEVAAEEESESTVSGPPPQPEPAHSTIATAPSTPAVQRAAVLGGWPRAQSPALKTNPGVTPAPTPQALRQVDRASTEPEPLGRPRVPMPTSPSQSGQFARPASQETPAMRPSQPVPASPSQSGQFARPASQETPAQRPSVPMPAVNRPSVPMPATSGMRAPTPPAGVPRAPTNPGQSGSMPAIPRPSNAGQSGQMPAIPKPGTPAPFAPSQGVRPNPIAPGSSAAKQVGVETMQGPFAREPSVAVPPRRSKRDTDVDSLSEATPTSPAVVVQTTPTPPRPSQPVMRPTPTPMRPSQTPSRPQQPLGRTTPTGGQPAINRPAGAKPPPGMSDADVDALYKKYVQAKEMVGEQTNSNTYGKLLNTINAQAPKIMEQYKAKGVDFSVVVKDNQVIIKAKPKP